MSKIKVTDIILLVMSASLALGMKLVFHACGAKEDGSWMTCHWAEQAVFAASLGLVGMAVLRLFLRRETQKGVSLAMCICAVTTALLPGVCIRLCMMDTMCCHAVMRPAVILICAVIAIVGIVDALHAGKEA